MLCENKQHDFDVEAMDAANGRILVIGTTH
jgi:hypothetical protein